MKRPILLYLIMILMVLMSIGALFGGYNLIKDPSGRSIQFPDNFLKKTFFHDYFFPGLILFLVIGILPLIIIYGLFKKDSFGFLEIFNIYRDKIWQFTFLIYYGLALIIWIDVQIIFVPYFFLQPIVSLFGVLILTLTIFKSVREYFEK